MRSVPPRGSRWVVDGVAMTPREYSVLPSDRCGSRTTRYRVVVLTSSPSKHCFLSNTLMEHYPFKGYRITAGTQHQESHYEDISRGRLFLQGLFKVLIIL